MKNAGVPVIRWGGDGASRYNYLIKATNSASDWYFENQNSAGTWPNTDFNTFVSGNQTLAVKTMGTVPVLGWVAKDTTSCSFPVATYPSQQLTDAGGAAAAMGCIPQVLADARILQGAYNHRRQSHRNKCCEGPAWAGAWVTSLVSTFGTAANGWAVSPSMTSTTSQAGGMRCTAMCIPLP